MDEKIATLNKMIDNYNSSYGHTLIRIKDTDDILDMKYDTEAVISSLEEQISQLTDIIEYIEYGLEVE